MERCRAGGGREVERWKEDGRGGWRRGGRRKVGEWEGGREVEGGW